MLIKNAALVTIESLSVKLYCRHLGNIPSLITWHRISDSVSCYTHQKLLKLRKRKKSWPQMYPIVFIIIKYLPAPASQRLPSCLVSYQYMYRKLSTKNLLKNLTIFYLYILRYFQKIMFPNPLLLFSTIYLFSIDFTVPRHILHYNIEKKYINKQRSRFLHNTATAIPC